MIVALIVSGALAIALGAVYLLIKFGIEERDGSRIFADAPGEFRDVVRVPEGDAQDWAGPMHGGTKLGRRMSAEMRSKGLMLPNRVSAAGRKLVVALDKARPASRGRTALAAAKKIAWLLALGPSALIPELERREAREAAAEARAAERGKHRAPRTPSAAALRPAAADPFAFLAAPLAPLPPGRVYAKEPVEILGSPPPGWSGEITEAVVPERAEKTLLDRLPLHADRAEVCESCGKPWDDCGCDWFEAIEPEDPCDVLTDEDEADAFVGSAAGPERCPENDSGRDCGCWPDASCCACGAPGGGEDGDEPAAKDEAGLFDRDADRWGDSLIMPAVKP